MATAIITTKHFCQFCLRRLHTCLEKPALLVRLLDKRSVLCFPPSNAKYLSIHTNISPNRYKTSFRTPTLCLMLLSKSNRISKDFCKQQSSSDKSITRLGKTFVTDASSQTEQDLEDIKVILYSKLSHDKQISDVQLEKYMNVLEVLFKTRLNTATLLELENVTSGTLPSEMYTLASKIFSLQNKVGEEAIVVATPLFRIAALTGDKNAKYSYGQLLFRGAGGLSANPYEAASLFTELAKEGHPHAQFTLAGMYYTGYGIDQSYETSYTLYQVAAENGVIQSYNSIGKMYLNGDGVDQDEKKAFEYFMKGAEAGDTHAYMSVAHCYSHNKGVDKDYEQAYIFHQKAAEQEYPPAIYNIGTHYFSGKGVSLDMSKAANCFQRAAELGFTLAEVNLGNMYYHGLGVEKNLQKAKELYQRAAPKHHNARILLEELELEEKKLNEKTED